MTSSSIKGLNERKKEDNKEQLVTRLESKGRLLSLISKADTKRVSKRKIITFLKKKEDTMQ